MIRLRTFGRGSAPLSAISFRSLTGGCMCDRFPVMDDDIATVRRVGLHRAYALIRGLEADRGFARLTPEQRALWEERAEARAQAFCDGLAADLALMTSRDDDG
jgi:hypothetical protein